MLRPFGALLLLFALAVAVIHADLRDLEEHRSFDAIVIGSGSSALGAAYKLVEEKNKRILVLEKGWQAGGCQQTFVFNGTDFQTGFDVDTCPRSQWSLEQISGPSVHYDWPAGYPRERVYIGGRVYDIPNGPNEYISWLYDHLGVNAADTLISHMDGMGHNSRVEFAIPGMDFLPPPDKRDVLARKAVADATMMEIGPQTMLMDYLGSLTNDTDAQTMLVGVVLLCLGLPPNVIPAFPIVQAVAQLSGGFSYPVQGPDVAVDRMVENIQARGGVVQIEAEVTQILVDSVNNVVTGVQLRNGTVFSSNKVLSTIGVDAMLRVMDGIEIPDWYYPDGTPRVAVSPYTQSGSGFLTFVTLDKPARELGLAPLMTSWKDMGLAGMADILTGMFTDNLPLFMVETTLKTTAFDPSLVPQPNAAMILWTPMYAGAFAAWANTQTHQRFEPPGYYEYKQVLQDLQFARLYDTFPQLVGHAVAAESATPLTIRDFVAKPNGAFMSNVGLTQHPSYWTGIRGLYVAGADIVGGADKAPMTGALAAAEMLGDVGMFTKYLKRIQ